MQGKWKLVAEILTGSLFYIEVDEGATVGELKKAIGNQEDLPTHRLILLLDADQRILLRDDEVPLKEYRVRDGSHIYIFFKPLDDNSAKSPSTPQGSVSNNPSPCGDIINARLDKPSSSVDLKVKQEE